MDEQLYFKLKQISKDDCNWLLEEDIDKCKLRLDDVIKKEFENEEPKIEHTFIHNSNDEMHIKIDEKLEGHMKNNTKFRFTARADLVTETTVWELKCTNFFIDP